MTTVFSLLQYHTKLFKLETLQKSNRNYSSHLTSFSFKQNYLCSPISKLLNPKLFMLKELESAKRIDLRFQELRFVRFKNNALGAPKPIFIKICARNSKAIFKLFCTKRSSRNRYFICFAQKGTPETIFQFVLNKKELLKLIFRMVCTFRSSFHHKTKCFAQKGASETDIHF